jgi:hypothetical protein
MRHLGPGLVNERLEKPSLQVGDVPADFHALTRRRNLHRDKRGCCEKANGMIEIFQ